MSEPADTAARMCRDLARVAAAGLRVPDFLVLAERAEGKIKWLDAGLVPVAEHWLAASRGEALLPEAVGLVSDIAIAMDKVLESFLEMHPEAPGTEQQRRPMAWEMQRHAVLAWLAQTTAQELNAAARAWRPADEPRLAWQAWEQMDTLPGLSKLRACLAHRLRQRLPEYDPVERFCGMRPIGR